LVLRFGYAEVRFMANAIYPQALKLKAQEKK